MSPTSGTATGSYPYEGSWNWPRVIRYEVDMLTALVQIPPTHPARSEWVLTNCIVEGIVLHTRNLCDLCTSTHPNDIKPADLFNDYGTDQKYQKLRDLVNLLKDKYEANSDPSNPGSVRLIFNKRLAHPTKDRTEKFDYAPYLNRVLPVLREIVNEMVALEGLPRDVIPGPSGSSPTP